MDSPWAHDACVDIARGYLTARLVDSRTVPLEFCQRYAEEVSKMQIAPTQNPPEERQKQSLDDLHQLRRRANEKAFLRHAERDGAYDQPRTRETTSVVNKVSLRPKAINEGVALAARVIRSGAIDADPALAGDKSILDNVEDDGADFWRTESPS